MPGDRFRVLLEAKLLMEAMLGRPGNNGSGEDGGFGDVMMKLTELWERDDDMREGMGKWQDVLRSLKW